MAAEAGVWEQPAGRGECVGQVEWSGQPEFPACLRLPAVAARVPGQEAMAAWFQAREARGRRVP